MRTRSTARTALPRSTRSDGSSATRRSCRSTTARTRSTRRSSANGSSAIGRRRPHAAGAKVGSNAMSQQRTVRTVIMRGGSSKALFVAEADLPKDAKARDRFLLALFGSPDKRQIDGLGGADYLTSKCAIIGPPTLRGADVDYTIAQVSVEHPVVSFDTNCGNISAAVGPYAIEEGIVKPVEPWTEVRVHNTNTGKILRLKVPVKDGHPVSEGDFEIDGVPGTGA